MSYKVEIVETNNKLEISSSVNEQAPTLDIIQEASSVINVVHDVALLPSDFNDNTENIIKSFLKSGYGISLLPSGDYFVVQTSGLQPSGNYSLSGHNHSSLDITDFGLAVSGLLPVKNIISGSGISVSNDNNAFTVAVTGQFGLTAEQVDDRVNDLLVSGSGISLSYDDFNDRLTISTVGLQPSGNYSLVGHSHNISDVNGLQNILDNKAALVHTHSAEAIVSGTLDFNRLPFTVTYPVRAVHVGGMIAFNNFSDTISPAYYWNGTYGDLQTLATMQFPDTSVYVDVSQSVTKYLNDNPGKTLTYASLEAVLIDAANRIVGWGTTASSPAPNPSNGTAGTSMTIQLLSFPSISNTWVIGGLPTSGTNTVDILPITSYKKVASRWLDIEKHDWNNVVNPPVTYSPSSHSHGNITNEGTIGNQSNQILITTTSGLITTNSNIPSTQISGFDISVSGLVHNIYAPLYSPTFSGIPTAPTATSGTSSSQIANTQFVRNEISNLINSAPSTLDTLNELASALGNDPNFATTIASGLGSKANLSGAAFSGGVSAPSGDFNILKQNGVVVSVSGHKHYANDILDFNPMVSGLLPVKDIVGGNNITIINSSGQFTVAVTGQLGLTAEQVDDRVSGLLNAGNYVSLNYNDDNNLLTVSVTGLQPSGNYSLVGHTHTSSEITDFNSSVSGLLPVKDILAGTYINVTSTSGIYTINSTGEANLLETNVFNKTGSPIPKLSVVYINGGQGDQPTISLASASGEMTSSKTYGITAQNIANMSTGKVIVAGALTGVNTDQFNPTAPQGDINGTILWLSPTTPGGLTTTKPTAPYHMVSVGTVVRTHQNEGVIEVRIQNGFELEELHNVAISGVANNQFIKYDSSSSLWKNVTATAGDISDFNSSVSGLLPITELSAGSNISIIPSGSLYTIATSGLITGSKTLSIFTAMQNQPPASSFATLDTRNSIAVLDFDAATKETAVFVGIIPEGASLTSGLNIIIHWIATSATSGDVVWEASLERSNTDLDIDSFDVVATAVSSTNGTSGIITKTTILLTTIDSIMTGDLYRLRISRDATNASDTMIGDAELVAVEVRGAL